MIPSNKVISIVDHNILGWLKPKYDGSREFADSIQAAINTVSDIEIHPDAYEDFEVIKYEYFQDVLRETIRQGMPASQVRKLWNLHRTITEYELMRYSVIKDAAKVVKEYLIDIQAVFIKGRDSGDSNIETLVNDMGHHLEEVETNFRNKTPELTADFDKEKSIVENIVHALKEIHAIYPDTFITDGLADTLNEVIMSLQCPYSLWLTPDIWSGDTVEDAADYVKKNLDALSDPDTGDRGHGIAGDAVYKVLRRSGIIPTDPELIQVGQFASISLLPMMMEDIVYNRVSTLMQNSELANIVNGMTRNMGDKI